jgi:hypothetical protein
MPISVGLGSPPKAADPDSGTKRLGAPRVGRVSPWRKGGLRRPFCSGASRTRTGDLLGAIRARAVLESLRFAAVSSATRPVQGSQNAQGLAAITESLPPQNSVRGQTPALRRRCRCPPPMTIWSMWVASRSVLCSASTATALLLPGLDLGEFAAELVERHPERWLLFDEVILIADCTPRRIEHRGPLPRRMDAEASARIVGRRHARC